MDHPTTRMMSPEMRNLAESIRENGEAIKMFREQYIPALRSKYSDVNGNSTQSTTSAGASTAAEVCSSPAEHAQLIQGVLDNLDRIQTLASASEKRIALPVESECDVDFNIRNYSILEDLNALPQTRILNAVRSQTEEIDSLVQRAEKAANRLRNCT